VFTVPSIEGLNFVYLTVVYVSEDASVVSTLTSCFTRYLYTH